MTQIDVISPNTIVEKTRSPEPFVYSPIEKPGIDIHVAEQFPSFVSEDHPRFIQFMESYYEWTQSLNGVLKKSQTISEQQDIDTADDIFQEQLFKEFLVNVPRNVSVNKATILKHIKQFYRAKGTEKSYVFLFRLLFNTKVNLYYPKVDILKASDGKWIKNKTIRLISTTQDAAGLKGKRIIGTISNSSAFVERTLVITEDAFSGLELFFNISSITGEFYANEPVKSEDGKLLGIISPIPVEYTIIHGGGEYKVDQTFYINHIGKGARVRVSEVDSDGKILALTIERYGLGYSTNSPPVNFSLGNNIDSSKIAIVTFTLGAVTDYPGYYANDDGQLSAAKYLHDGEYYQQFSYLT